MQTKTHPAIPWDNVCAEERTSCLPARPRRGRLQGAASGDPRLRESELLAVPVLHRQDLAAADQPVELEQVRVRIRPGIEYVRDVGQGRHLERVQAEQMRRAVVTGVVHRTLGRLVRVLPATAQTLAPEGFQHGEEGERKVRGRIGPEIHEDSPADICFTLFAFIIYFSA